MGGVDASGERVLVLLVEDDATLATMHRVRLEMDGHRVVVAKDGEAGLRLARELLPDLVILDYRLPRLDGAGVLRALRAGERTRDLVVVVLSAFDDPRLMAEGRALGAAEWLVKGRVSPAQLAAVVRRLSRLELDLPA
jgi:two-component system phosphate regulon response regulator PhoB